MWAVVTISFRWSHFPAKLVCRLVLTNVWLIYSIFTFCCLVSQKRSLLPRGAVTVCHHSDFRGFHQAISLTAFLFFYLRSSMALAFRCVGGLTCCCHCWSLQTKSHLACTLFLSFSVTDWSYFMKQCWVRCRGKCFYFDLFIFFYRKCKLGLLFKDVDEGSLWAVTVIALHICWLTADMTVLLFRL